MKYSEYFYTLQGEGKLVGVPSVFFRMSYCNLRCWWCDSAYTSWHPENKDISVDEAFAKISSFGVKHVVITGGEPFIQKEPLTELCQKLHDHGHHITIETNATVFLPVKADLISMSPKLANSTPANDPIWTSRHERKRIEPAVIHQFLEHYDCQLKFVVDVPQDLDEIKTLVEENDLPEETFVLMPQGLTEDVVNEKQLWLAELCKTHGYRYSPRLHINIWGDKRGT